MKKQLLFYSSLILSCVFTFACNGRKKQEFNPTEPKNIESDIQMLKGLEVAYRRLLDSTSAVAKDRVSFTVDRKYTEGRNIYNFREDGTVLQKYPANGRLRIGDGVMYFDKNKNLTHFEIKDIERSSDSLYLDSIARLLIKYNVRFINTRSYYGNFTIVSTPKKQILLHPPNDLQILTEHWKGKNQNEILFNDSTLIYENSSL